MDETKESSAQTSAVCEPADFICDCYEEARPACAGEPLFAATEAGQFCVLHYPSNEKITPFRDAYERKIARGDFNFFGVWFPSELDLSSMNLRHGSFPYATFADEVMFHGSTFLGAPFQNATFLSNAYFNNCIFEGQSWFISSTFKGEAVFNGATFQEDASFLGASFNGRVFFSGIFNGHALFGGATFRDAVIFRAYDDKDPFVKTIWADFRFSLVEKPERVTFDSVTLDPIWFIDSDARKFNFRTVKWRLRRIRNEIADLEAKRRPLGHSLLSTAYSRLAENAEENREFSQASRFRYGSLEAQRLGQFHGWYFLSLTWWYWVASGYGERIWRAALALLGIILLFGVSYTYVGFENPGSLGTRDGLLYSVQVAALQKPDPKPVTRWAKSLVLTETIFGPAQAALLLLAIRRKFMR